MPIPFPMAQCADLDFPSTLSVSRELVNLNGDLPPLQLWDSAGYPNATFFPVSPTSDRVLWVSMPVRS